MAEDGAAQGVGVGARRGRGRRFVVALAVTAIAAWLTSGSAPHAAPLAADSDWRWESYGGIEVRVPANWKRGTWGQVDCPSAASRKPNPSGPTVVPLPLCMGRVPHLEDRQPAIWFDWRGKPEVESREAGWVLETRGIGKVRVTVYTDDNTLRTTVFDSARRVDGVDHNGCTPDHEATIDPDYRPTAKRGLAGIGAIRSMSICHYTIDPHDKQMVSSSILTGGSAQRILNRILAAPEGGGPDDPSRLCNRWNLRGEDLMVLIVRGAEGTQEVLVRYSGCKGNGTDDGATNHRLTADFLRSLFTGSHHYIKLGVRVTYMLYPK